MSAQNPDRDGFSYDVRRLDGQAVVALAGELDLATAPTLVELLESLCERRVPSVVLDLADLEFCDSSGLSVLVHGRRAAEEQGTQLVLRAPPPAIRSLLEITSLSYLLEPARGASSGRPRPRRSP